MMPRLPITLALIAFASTAAIGRPAGSPAAELAGRTAGAPVECIGAVEGDRGGDIYDSGDILYRGHGSRLYLNHPDNCPALRSDRRIVSRSPSGRQCRGDILTVEDRISPAFYGSCALGSFIPYDRPRTR